MARVLSALLGGGLLIGCQDSSVPLVGVYHPTLIEVSPDEFLGDIPCKEVPGAMRSYVATVYDLEFDPDGNYQGDTLGVDAGVGGASGDGDGSGGTGLDPATDLEDAPIGFALPSSGPLSCKQAVAFARVVEPHRYRAEILGFERPTASLAPLGLGVPLMVNPLTNERVSPRWRIRCGDRNPARALSFFSTKVRDCQLVSDAGGDAPTGPTEVRVTLGAALGALECGTGSGQVDHFELEQSDGSSLSAPCGGTLTLTDVAPNARFSADVLVYEAGRAEPRWGTLCSASPSPGLSVNATCAPLDDHGALDVEPGGALGALGFDCAALSELPGELSLTLVDQDTGEQLPPTRYINAATCARSTRFTGLVSGSASISGTLKSGPTELGSVVCAGHVIPGRATPATCATEP